MEALPALGDQTRWQPWVFLYGFLLGTLALFSWDSEDVAGRNRALNIARLIIAATYLFSGLQKINLNFMQQDFPWIVSPITDVIWRQAGFLLARHFLERAASLPRWRHGGVHRPAMPQLRQSVGFIPVGGALLRKHS